MSETPQKRLFIKTYGCQMNVYDSERMADVLRPLGYGVVDEPEGADRGVLVDRGHRRDPVPDVPDSVHAERVFIRSPRDDAVRGRHISPRYHAVHSVQRFGRVSVDRYDASVWVRAAENLAVQHAGEHQIVGVERSTRRLVEPLDLPHGSAD